MPVAQLLALLCAGLLAVMAFGASTASAQTIIGVEHEEGDDCNPCFVHMSGESELHAGPNRISTCEDEFEAEIYTQPDINGIWGHVVAYTNTDHNALPCTREAGRTSAGAFIEWPITSAAETGGESGMATITLALQAKNPTPENANLDVTCPVEVNGLGDHVSHHHTYSTNTTCPIGVRIQATGETESSSVTHDGVVAHHASE